MTELPNGWVETVLDEIAATSLGKMLDAKQRTGLHQTPYLRNVNVRWGTFDLSDVATMDIEPRELDRVLAQPGDLVACEGGEPGRSAVWRGKEAIALQKALHKIRPATGVLPDYLALLLREQSSSGELDKLFTGTTIKHLPQEKVRLVRVPLAPTAEQERIVAAIEEAFSKLDAGEAGLRTVRQLLKRMRGAVLASAVTGRLVPQDPTDAPAAKLLAGLGVEASATAADLPSGWCQARLGELIGPEGLFVDGDWVESKDQDPAGEVRLTQLADIGVGYWRDRSNRFMTAAASERLGCTLLAPGDVLVARMPDPLGRACEFPGDPRPCVTVVDVAIVRPDKRSIVPTWLMWAINSRPVRTEVESLKAGTTRKRISRKNLASITLAVPPVGEQRRIVIEVERQFSFLGACERWVATGLDGSTALRRSVLKAAFEGKLVPQDPSDEPASVLLGRIRAERAMAPRLARSKRTA